MLKLTNNSKTKFYASQRNTFGLLHGLPKNGGTCVGATCGKGGCLDTRDGLKRKTCYVEKLTQIYKNVGIVLKYNTELLADKTQEEIIPILEATVAKFVKKTKPEFLFFRLHWSGDFMTPAYASAWAEVIKRYPAVRFWVYTRSFRKGEVMIESLLGLPNLSLFLSCDPNNIADALEFYEKHRDANKNLGLAWMGNSDPNLKDIKFVVCPATSGKIKNTKENGACAKCRLCVNNYVNRIKNIRFLLH